MSAPVVSEFERACWDADRAVASIRDLASSAEYALSQMSIDDDDADALHHFNSARAAQDGIVALAEKVLAKLDWIEGNGPRRSAGKKAHAAQ